MAPPLWLPPPDWDDTAAARAPRSTTEVSSPAAAPAWEEMAGEMPGKLCGIRMVGLSLCYAYDGCMISWCSCVYDCCKGCFDYLYVMVMIVVWIVVWRIWMITEVQQSISIQPSYNYKPQLSIRQLSINMIFHIIPFNRSHPTRRLEIHSKCRFSGDKHL